VETCELSAVDPLARMSDTLTKLVNLWPASRIDELMLRNVTRASRRCM
jgi:transposase